MEEDSSLRDFVIDGVRRRLQILKTFRAEQKSLPIQEFQSTSSLRLTSLLSEGGVVCLMGPSGSGMHFSPFI
jgi:ABC-type lipoprotein export system ATPase subunit